MTGLLPNAFLPLTIPASWMYGRMIAIRNARYDRGIGVESIGRPVISVGNLTTGGTGKTPMVMWIAEQLLALGHHPVIAMRGYKARANEPSDEQAEYAARLPDVPVVAHPDRAGALRQYLPRHPEIDCVLLDDGFQHRRIKRDLDLVLIDATADTMNDRLLPAGNLREPIANLHRADGVIITHADSEISNLKYQIEQSHGKPPLAWSRHVWTHLDVYEAGNAKRYDVDWLRGKRVLTMLGVGKPQSIRRQLELHGARVAVNIPCGDHEHFDRAKLGVARGLCDGCDAVVVTEKDWVKLEKLIELSSWSRPVVVPQLAIEFVEGEQVLRDRMLGAVGTPTAGTFRESAR